MDKPTLLSVPPELQTAIVSYILRPSDLKSLCLSCQQLGAVATEQLYNDVLLDVGKRTRKPGFFVTNHRGHRHIRSLTVFVAPDGYGTYQFMYCPSANLATRLALQLIPRNILKHFSTELAVQPETITTLVTQQRTMENLALGAIKGDIRELTLNLPQFLPRLKRLFIPCRSGARFDKRSHDPEVRMWGELVRSCRQLKHVALFLASDPDDDDVCSVQDGQEQENQARDMFEGLLRPLNVCDPMKSLDELHLQDLYLGPADCDLTTMVNFESLQWLSINNSFNSVVLVQKLSMTFAKSVPKLRGLIWHDETDYVNVTFNHLQHLLQSFSGLQYLSIVSEQYEGVAMFDLRCLKTHLASLRHLWLWGGYMQDIHQQEDELWTISLTEVQTLARKAQSLCQFALSFPALKMRDFKNGSMEYYNEFIDAIVALPELEILHVLAWPVAQLPEGPHTKTSEGAYLKDLDSLANHFARRLTIVQPRSRKLKAICFGRPSYSLTVGVPAEDGKALHTAGRAFYVINRSGKIPSATRVNRLSMRYDEPLLNMVSSIDGTDRGMSIGGFGSMHTLRMPM